MRHVPWNRVWVMACHVCARVVFRSKNIRSFYIRSIVYRTTENAVTDEAINHNLFKQLPWCMSYSIARRFFRLIVSNSVCHGKCKYLWFSIVCALCACLVQANYEIENVCALVLFRSHTVLIKIWLVTCVPTAMAPDAIFSSSHKPFCPCSERESELRGIFCLICV